MPNAFFWLVLVAYPLVAWACLSTLGPRRGVMAALLGGWLFAPSFNPSVADVPLFHTKTAFIPAIVLMLSLLVDSGRWRGLRLRWPDAPVLVVCLLPFVTALMNDLGPYEGGSALLDALFVWGAPYLIARVYFSKARGMLELATWVAGCAIVYIPFCLWEVRMSPQLHTQLYGFTTGPYGQSVRFGGYRPVVFQSHGLMVGMLMASGTLAAYWLWRTRAVPRFRGVGMGWWTLLLSATTILVKSSGSILLLGAGLLILESIRRFRTIVLVYAVLALTIAFPVARSSGWSPFQLVNLATEADADRGESMAYRVKNEDILLAKALKRPWLGWGRFGRARVTDEFGRDTAVTDSMWIIVLGTGGIAALVALGGLLLSPILLLRARFRTRFWSDRRLAPAAIFAVLPVLWTVDCLLNSMPTPIYPAMAGALVGFLARRTPSRPPAASAGTARVALAGQA